MTSTSPDSAPATEPDGKKNKKKRNRRPELSSRQIVDTADRDLALDVIKRTYEQEKSWIGHPSELFPAEDLENPAIAWFLTLGDGQPVGVMRVLYEIPFDLYHDYGFELVNTGIDVEAFLRDNKIAEIGRFAVVPEYRRNIFVAAHLIKAATTETVGRGFTHFITDVFEGEATSPYNFHRRILGFKEVATHEHGEIGFVGRRITMLLDLREAYRRLSRKRGWVFRFITSGWDDTLVGSLDSP